MLFWDPWMDRAKYAQVAQGRQIVYPGVPEGGRASTRATPIALLDSGVATAHPQLAGYIAGAADFTGEGPEDTLGHGTALALIAVFGARDMEVSILSAKVADRAGRVREKDVIAGIDWAVARGARVVNLSLGFPGRRAQYRALCETIARHWSVVFFASAGYYERPTEVYPANCRLGNLHVTWNPQPRPDELLLR